MTIKEILENLRRAPAKDYVPVKRMQLMAVLDHVAALEATVHTWKRRAEKRDEETARALDQRDELRAKLAAAEKMYDQVFFNCIQVEAKVAALEAERDFCVANRQIDLDTCNDLTAENTRLTEKLAEAEKERE